MIGDKSGGQPSFIDRFSTVEKTLMRLGLYGFTVIGAVGIFVENTGWGVFYVALAALGQFFVVVPALCGPCPYPHECNDCLLAPAGMIRRICRFRPGPMGLLEKAGFISVGAALVILPQFWLIRSPLLMGLFWLVCLPTLAAFPLYYCGRCRHTACPFNRAPVDPR